jgi:hypothetical protein
MIYIFRYIIPMFCEKKYAEISRKKLEFRMRKKLISNGHFIILHQNNRTF